MSPKASAELACRLFALPVDIKNSLPKADWHSGQKIYGMESNKVAGMSRGVRLIFRL